VDPAKTNLANFKRLCKWRRWSAKERHVRRVALCEAIVAALAREYDVDRLACLQELCVMLRPEDPVPNSIKACRAVLSRVHINLFDMMEGDTQKTWPSVRALSEYTLENKKVFPLNEGKNNPIAKLFLRRLVYGRRRAAADN
jgi:hypothetical protein